MMEKNLEMKLFMHWWVQGEEEERMGCKFYCVICFKRHFTCTN